MKPIEAFFGRRVSTDPLELVEPKITTEGKKLKCYYNNNFKYINFPTPREILPNMFMHSVQVFTPA